VPAPTIKSGSGNLATRPACGLASGAAGEGSERSELNPRPPEPHLFLGHFRGVRLSSSLWRYVLSCMALD